MPAIRHSKFRRFGGRGQCRLGQCLVHRSSMDRNLFRPSWHTSFRALSRLWRLQVHNSPNLICVEPVFLHTRSRRALHSEGQSQSLPKPMLLNGPNRQIYRRFRAASARVSYTCEEIHYNRRHTSSESGVGALRLRQPDGRRTHVGSIQYSLSAKPFCQAKEIGSAVTSGRSRAGSPRAGRVRYARARKCRAGPPPATSGYFRNR
jgi:hypothetical protein